MHTLLLDEAGKVLAFGSGANGRLGLGSTTTIAKPAEIAALAHVTVKSIACGWSSR
jgi:alpha-tubulin suppressor-like RCC1 family protein